MHDPKKSIKRSLAATPVAIRGFQPSLPMEDTAHKALEAHAAPDPIIQTGCRAPVYKASCARLILRAATA